MTASSEAPDVGRPFRHEALFYSSTDDFVAGTASFIRAGLEQGEAVFAVLDLVKIDRLRHELGADASRVEFADMASVGRNPALIIQAWRDFAGRRAEGQGIRGIGEPISADRDDAAMVECHIHESLLNVAFEHDTDFWLLCPYDTTTLAAPVLERAAASHPYLRDRVGADVSSNHSGAGGHDGRDHAGGAGFDWPLTPATGPVESIGFDRESLRALRAFVAEQASRAGVDDDRVRDLVVASSEIATNSICHGGGPGDTRVWVEGASFVAEIRGAGRISDPLAGRLRPEPGRASGYGLWLANQCCDLVQIRSTDDGTTVRLHVRRV